MLTTIALYFTNDKIVFWILSLIIGFFIGPIQAANRKFNFKKIRIKKSVICFLHLFNVWKYLLNSQSFFSWFNNKLNFGYQARFVSYTDIFLSL